MKPKCRLFDFAAPEPEAKDYQRCLHVFLYMEEIQIF